MKVVVTGSRGFIGRVLVTKLRSMGLDVTGLDLKPVSSPIEQEVVTSILDESTLRSLFVDVDLVIHLAGYLGVQRADKNLLKCIEINAFGTQTVLKAASLAGVRRVIYSSSSEVLGDISDGILSEDSPRNPKSTYAISKLLGEELVKAYHQEYGIEYTVVRFFNVYGPAQEECFVVPKFVSRALAGLPLELYGGGSQTRSFCHVNDATEALIQLAMRPQSVNGLVHIGNPSEPISMNDLAVLVKNLTGSESDIQVTPFENSDRLASREIFHRRPNIEFLGRLTSFEPKVKLKDGIKSILDWMR